jgi:Tfp pilus assembly protein PilF
MERALRRRLKIEKLLFQLALEQEMGHEKEFRRLEKQIRRLIPSSESKEEGAAARVGL